MTVTTVDNTACQQCAFAGVSQSDFQQLPASPKLQSIIRIWVVQIGFLGPAFFLTQLSKVTSVGGAVACMMACQGLDACSQSGLYSNHQVDTL